VPKSQLQVSILLGESAVDCDEMHGEPLDANNISRPAIPPAPRAKNMVEVPLIALAWGRSGDKGNKANIGIIARQPEYLPFICAALTEEAVRRRFAHFLAGASANAPAKSVERFLLPGANAINFLLHDVLGGGGVASIRNDPQGKGYAQLLLSCPIPVPTAIVESLS
jgi:hypothetical protein